MSDFQRILFQTLFALFQKFTLLTVNNKNNKEIFIENKLSMALSNFCIVLLIEGGRVKFMKGLSRIYSLDIT